MGNRATATLTWAVQLDKIPWTEEERKDCKDCRHKWLYRKLGLIEEGKSWISIKDEDLILEWVEVGSNDENEGPFLLGVTETTMSADWDAPLVLTDFVNATSWHTEDKAKSIFIEAWKKIRPGEKAPEGKWYLVAYYGYG